MSRKKKKLRVEFRKNRQNDPARPDFTRKFHQDNEGLETEDLAAEERVSGKGSLSRFRTIVSESDDQAVRATDLSTCVEGRVLRAAGIQCLVQTVDGLQRECTVRRVLRAMAREERTAVVAGDRVQVLPLSDTEGVIERIEPRHGTLSRQMQRREHVLVANVDQVIIVASADDPPLKPGLIDRYLISALQGGIEPVICINKADLLGPERLQPWAGIYSQLGYQVVITSTRENYGVDRLRRILSGKASAFSGQSGVGKSSLLNAIQPDLNLRTGEISTEYRKGKHTTTLAQLHVLSTCSGWVVDTPGIRQMELWDIRQEDLASRFLEFRPFLPFCRFPGCTHSHEQSCAVKFAVDQELISLIRYQSYLKLLSDLTDDDPYRSRPNATQ
ncbi:MAG: ribosome small subunit-dependent GTPase A [Planctomycetales bacterium]